MPAVTGRHLQSPTVPYRPLPSPTVPYRPLPSPTVPYRPPPFPQFPVVPHKFPSSPAVPCRPPLLTTVPTTHPRSSCTPCILVSHIPVLSSSPKTAVSIFCGRGRHIFCRPVRSRALGSPSAGPCRAPGPLGTLHKTASQLVDMFS